MNNSLGIIEEVLGFVRPFRAGSPAGFSLSMDLPVHLAVGSLLCDHHGRPILPMEASYDRTGKNVQFDRFQWPPNRRLTGQMAHKRAKAQNRRLSQLKLCQPEINLPLASHQSLWQSLRSFGHPIGVSPTMA